MAVEQPPPADSARNEFDQLKGTFLSSLNHEIRTPLSGILGMADLLLETSLDEEQREYVVAARLCAESLFQILNATLEYSALEAGTLALDETEFSLRDLVESGIAQQREKATAKGLSLEAEFDHALPETMIGDAPRIRDILTHLLDNAVKFTTHGSLRLGLKGERSPEGLSLLTIVVKDTGMGIPMEQQEQIFESFRQGEGGLARGYSGLGLGLALVRKLLRLMGGSIEVQSEPGKGSAFTVHLPLRIPGESAREIAASAQDSAGPAILAVEDNPVGMMVLRHALKGRNVQMDGASDGFAAVAAAQRRRYALILMDLQMPGMDGLEATAEIRKLSGYADVPILALTADSSDELRRECLQHGMQGFLSKPVESNLLWAAVSRHLNPVI
jgi:CheY-like chemotaxis protein